MRTQPVGLLKPCIHSIQGYAVRFVLAFYVCCAEARIGALGRAIARTPRRVGRIMVEPFFLLIEEGSAGLEPRHLMPSNGKHLTQCPPEYNPVPQKEKTTSRVPLKILIGLQWWR